MNKVLNANPSVSIVTADLAFGRTQYQVDMTNMCFEDDSFDVVIANHVLEHIEDEDRAVNELMRVVRQDGNIILSFPIATNLEKNLEDKNVVTKEERLRLYGQEDHVRLYGADYKERLKKKGMDIEIYSPFMELSDTEIKEYGFIPDDITLICKNGRL